jgi:hypothetical protein
MTHNQLAGTFAFAAALLAAGSALAAGPTNAEYYPFQEVTAVKTTNVGVVSGANLTTNVRTMGASGDAAAIDQSRQILMYLKAGG